MNSLDKRLYPSTYAEAKKIQEEMAALVSLAPALKSSPKFIAGMDVSNNRFDPKKMVYAATVLLSYPELSVIQTQVNAERQDFPYITGLLAFREAPALVKTFEMLSIRPDVLLVDGQGISHPRGLGIASHLGVLLDIPTIGVAKSVLIGAAEAELPEEAGSMLPMFWKGQVVAMLLRTKNRCSPLIISPGHKISLLESVNVVMDCLKGYRLPEPTRQAHLAANNCRKSHLSNFHLM